jgi:hypothetical protein
LTADKVPCAGLWVCVPVSHLVNLYCPHSRARSAIGQGNRVSWNEMPPRVGTIRYGVHTPVARKSRITPLEASSAQPCFATQPSS